MVEAFDSAGAWAMELNLTLGAMKLVINTASRQIGLVALIGVEASFAEDLAVFSTHFPVATPRYPPIFVHQRTAFFSNINRYIGFPYTQIYMYQDSS